MIEFTSPLPLCPQKRKHTQVARSLRFGLFLLLVYPPPPCRDRSLPASKGGRTLFFPFCLASPAVSFLWILAFPKLFLVRNIMQLLAITFSLLSALSSGGNRCDQRGRHFPVLSVTRCNSRREQDGGERASEQSRSGTGTDEANDANVLIAEKRKKGEASIRRPEERSKRN